jgi:hypothetical protein
VLPGGYGADEDVGGAALYAVIFAEVEQAGGFDEVIGCDFFVEKWVQYRLQLGESR